MVAVDIDVQPEKALSQIVTVLLGISIEDKA